MDFNPYQSPTTECAPALGDGSFRVEGKLLVVRSGAVLPPICVKTNQPVSPHDVVSRRLTWCSPLVALLILLSGLLLILVYFLVRRHCTLTFGLLPAVRRKYRNRRLVKSIAAIALFFALPVTAAMDSTAVTIVVLVLFLVSIVSLFIGNSPLSVTNYRKGEFWIAGCSKDFLAGIQSRAVS